MPNSHTHSWLDDDRSIAYWSLLLGTPLALAIGVTIMIPTAIPVPGFYEYVIEYVRTGHIAEVAFPLEYTWLVALCTKVFGQRGLEILQSIMYVLTVLSVWGIARRLGCSCRYALVAGLLAAIYPQLPASIAKLWDVDFSVWVMVALMLCIFLILQNSQKILLVIATGLIFGSGMAQRPNMLLLLPLLVYAIFSSRALWPRKILALLVGGAVSAATLIAINTLAHGSFFLPQDGPYNFVQGHNEYTIGAMLRNQTPEQSVALFMKADGIDYGDADIITHPRLSGYTPALQHYFTHRAWQYICNHPLGEVEITAVKLYLFLSPYRRLHRGLSLWTIPVVAMALVIPVWLVLLMLKARRGLDLYDKVFIVAAFLYVLPFLLTAVDVRYQFPLDIALLPHIAKLIQDRNAVNESAPAMTKVELSRVSTR